MEDAIFDQTELQKIFVLIAFDQTGSRGRREGHEMGEVAREILAQIEAR